MAATPPALLSVSNGANGDDPFLSPSLPHHVPHRYASFDNSQTQSLFNSSSPSQAKRALEAHLKDTDRRIQDASRLGQTLLKQRKDLSERLKDVEHEKDDNEIGPELQKKLADLEKEYTAVGRESARTFLPKNRIVSQDLTGPGSPAVFAADSRASPSKLSAPSRRQRNQPANRVHDIEFATEISTSLLAQVRQLQAVLAEKDDTLRTTTAEKTQLETDIALLTHRLKVLDESEQKYKEENWNLETQLQEIQSSLKDLTDKENRLNQILKATQAERDAAQRDLEELKHSHGRLAEDQELFKKQTDAEFHGLRRDLANHESQRDVLQKKIEELTSQNTELARAVAARWHDGDQANDRSPAGGDLDLMTGGHSPDDSPPPSPSKTPARNGMLESETLKSSLTHAHRMIQSLKNNIHREKTEKIELKRMLQDARDEVESLRHGGNASVAKKRRSAQDNARKQIRPEKLGAARSSTQEIIMDVDDDEEWEDNGEASPSRAASTRLRNAASSTSSHPHRHVDTEHDNSTDAFETANERDGTTTESEAFETGVETLGGASSDDLTETEGTIRGKSSVSSRPSIYPSGNAGDRMSFHSFQSSASTDDEDKGDHVRTPVQQQHPKLRLRNVRSRRSARASSLSSQDPSIIGESPSSIHSSERGTPRAQAGQSLMAELEGLSDEGEESDAVTPSRSSLREDAAASARSSPDVHRQRAVTATTALGDAIGEDTPVKAIRPQMVDSSMMTEPWEPESSSSIVSSAAGAVGGAIAGVAGFALGKTVGDDAEEEAVESNKAPEAEAALAGVVSDPLEGSTKDLASSEPKALTEDMASRRREAVARANMGTPRAPLQKMADVVSQQTSPISPAPAAPSQLAFSSTTSAATEPVLPPKAGQSQPAALGFATPSIAETEPVSPAVAPLPQVGRLAFATPSTAETEPISPPPQQLTPLGFATSTTAETEPVAPVAATVPLAMSSMVIANTEPRESEARAVAEPFNFSTIVAQQSEPVTPAEGLRGAEFGNTPFSQRPDFYTDSGFSPEMDDEAAATHVPIYTDSGFSPEQQSRDVVIPGTEHVRPGAAFFSANPAVPPPSSQFPPRTSSIRSVSRDVRYADKSVDVFDDENSVAPKTSRPSTAASRTPFAEVSNNAAAVAAAATTTKPEFKKTHTSETGTQTIVSSEEIDNMLRNKERVTAVSDYSSAHSGTSPSKSSDSASLAAAALKAPRRPTSSGSMRKGTSPAPPLPLDHNLKIAAASGSMGPPAMPASAYKGTNGTLPPRSRTPSITTQSVRNGAGSIHRPRVSNPGSTRPTLELPTSPGTHTRRSSVTSFASELDERFHINNANIYPEDMPPATDPRMIQAITQTMIGEYLWKYTRKTGRSSEISGTRHRRFFWVHPYTRTLYWSETDPSLHGAKQSKAKSVAIEAIRVVSDNNTYPPGLHTKSLVVVTPGREIVFTAPTSARHETWFNALTYLLLRTGSQRAEDVNDTLGELTRDDVDEFNPQVRSNSRTSHRTGMTLSTYNSKLTRDTNSPMRREYLSEVPTLGRKDGQRTLNAKRSQAQSMGTPEPNNYGSVSSRLGTLFKSPGSLRGSFSSTRRSKSAMSNRPGDPSMIEEDSEDDLRAAVERGRREREEAGLMENVRACCDGKHDVGSLNRATGHTHTHGGAASGVGSVMSRHTSARSHTPSNSEPPRAPSPVKRDE
ncbi:hypothetical protein AAFC00_003943 [Neodothiora populina]|uniref:PH domain-containing protein n=1 Tax=Neodothiora populina TaxID=2781224 RepID=A0ABR3PHZ8_9PEZI